MSQITQEDNRMSWLTAGNVIARHSRAVERGGSLDVLRDKNIFESAGSAQFRSFCGKELFPTDLEKIARIDFRLAANHAFLDINKRIDVIVVQLLSDGITMFSNYGNRN